MLIEVTEPSQMGEARRKAVACAESIDLSEVRCGQVALATAEIATNLVKHAGRGYVLVQRLRDNGSSGVRVTGVDKGPGIADVAEALVDGNTSGDSMGTGLGTIQRVSDTFDLYSVPGAGTVISAEFWQGKAHGSHQSGGIEIGFVSEPIRGEDVNGDGWAVRASGDSLLLMVIDGLGHGILAAEAAREAERIFRETKATGVEAIINDAHLALKKTRGAAGGIAKIDATHGILAFAGVGNVCASVLEPGFSRSLVSHNGTLGQQMERLQEFRCPWNPDSILVMHSDGLVSRWDLQLYPGLLRKRANVIAAVLHRDFARGRDDVTVLVAKAAAGKTA